MKTNNLKSLHGLAVIIVAATSSAFLASSSLAAPAAPTYTGLGSTSTGTVGIEVNKPAQARISAMTSMTLPDWHIDDGDKTIFTTACIYSTSGAYSVTATGSGTSNAFTLTDTSGLTTALHVLPYTVNWDDAGVGSIGQVAGTALTAAQAANFANATTVSGTCAAGPGFAAGNNAQINIGFLAADLTALASGTFDGVLTIVVAPI